MSGHDGGGASPIRKPRKKMTEAERIKEMEAAALNAAILKPFLESLFDDAREGAGASTSQAEEQRKSKVSEEEKKLQPATGATVGMSGMPSMRYHDALQRECAKPFRLNTVVSIDAAPLPTRTAPPVYSELLQLRTGELPQHAACLRHEFREELRRSFAQGRYAGPGGSPVKRAAHQGPDEREHDPDSKPIEIEAGPGARAIANYTGVARPPEQYGPVKQGQMLEDAHLEMLLRTVSEVRSRQIYEKMWENGDRSKASYW